MSNDHKLFQLTFPLYERNEIVWQMGKRDKRNEVNEEMNQ